MMMEIIIMTLTRMMTFDDDVDNNDDVANNYDVDNDADVDKDDANSLTPPGDKRWLHKPVLRLGPPRAALVSPRVPPRLHPHRLHHLLAS